MIRDIIQTIVVVGGTVLGIMAFTECTSSYYDNQAIIQIAEIDHEHQR